MRTVNSPGGRTQPPDASSQRANALDTRNGALRLVRAARLGTYEDAAWARWLPGGNQLIIGAGQGSYAISAATLSASTLSFAPGSDINFSATILPGPKPGRCGLTTLCQRIKPA